MSPQLTDPADFRGAFAYEHSDIPPGMTVAAWRRQNARPQSRARRTWRRVARRLGRRPRRLKSS